MTTATKKHTAADLVQGFRAFEDDVFTDQGIQDDLVALKVLPIEIGLGELDLFLSGELRLDAARQQGSFSSPPTSRNSKAG